ncbi:serine hydrolase [candidate division KSB3 bacterium]|uniref:Serine hydrolase n=1 Tax=candidate division KSB3 bacterium TaxID=2044937 RepID=A0A2G6E8Y0_9BACT|nr:MAG: serine hydrolase [candidate division KSB3 bacterium]PIE30532.1 MAG: serine hydrolase [candidate division KSB3 bacterium]
MKIELVSPEKIGMSAKTLSLIDEFALNGIKALSYRGVVVLVARHGQICYFKAHGAARQGQPMETNAVFRQASMTKPIVMAAFLQFYEQGHFQLDDPLSRYLPAFKDLQVAVDDGNGNINLVPAKRDVTMHDLMSYSAGFTSTIFYGLDAVNSYVAQSYVDNGVRDLFHDDYTHTLEDNVNAIAQCPLLFHPGEGWQYAHASHDIIGYLIEQFSGTSLDRYLEQAIFAPLSMTESWFYPPESVFPRIPEATVMHNSEAPFVEHILGLLPENQEYSFGKNTSYLSAGGGLHCTACDYFRFAQMMLNKGELDGVRILKPQSVEFMTQPTSEHFQISGLTGNMWGYGLDVQNSDTPGGSGLWLGGKGSYGWRGIWSTLWNNNPTNDTVAIILTQVGDDGAFPYIYLLNAFVSAAVLD